MAPVDGGHCIQRPDMGAGHGGNLLRTECGVLMSLKEINKMKWLGRSSRAGSSTDRFMLPDGSVMELDTAGLSMDEAFQAAYKKWRKSK